MDAAALQQRILSANLLRSRTAHLRNATDAQAVATFLHDYDKKFKAALVPGLLHDLRLGTNGMLFDLPPLRLGHPPALKS
jgi:hypothetical protein